ncbi:MAG: hypothetical protein WBQ68_11925 [Terriglobales bacterium]
MDDVIHLLQQVGGKHPSLLYAHITDSLLKVAYGQVPEKQQTNGHLMFFRSHKGASSMETQIHNFTKAHLLSFEVKGDDTCEFCFTGRDGLQVVIVVSEKQAIDLATSIDRCLMTKS